MTWRPTPPIDPHSHAVLEGRGLTSLKFYEDPAGHPGTVLWARFAMEREEGLPPELAGAPDEAAAALRGAEGVLAVVVVGPDDPRPDHLYARTR